MPGVEVFPDRREGVAIDPAIAGGFDRGLHLKLFGLGDAAGEGRGGLQQCRAHAGRLGALAGEHQHRARPDPAGGSFDQAARSYRDNVVVFAEPLQ